MKPAHDQLSAYAPTLGRILLGGYFLWTGIEAALYFPGAVTELINLSVPQPMYAAIAIIGIEVIGGVALVLGTRIRLTALILSIYTVAVAAVYAPLMLSSSSSGNFLAQVGIIGGLLYMAGTTNPRD